MNHRVPAGMDRRQLLRGMALTLGGLMLPVNWLHAAENPIGVRNARVWTAPDHTRVIFELDNPIEHTLFRLSNPERVVLDFQNSKWESNQPVTELKDEVIRAFRTGVPHSGTVRAVFELTQEVRPRSFLLPAGDGQPARLVVDFYRKENMEETASSAKNTTTAAKSAHGGKRVIMIDPGHGGYDPGAIGPAGTKEKDVTLSIGKMLRDRINRVPGLQAMLTREGDYYVPLRKRVMAARKYQAEMFMSVHADAFRIASVRGASVYCLSEGGKPAPDNLIRDLERQENEAQLISGVDLSKVSDTAVQEILLDLSQRDAINKSMVLGETLLRNLGNVTKLKFKSVKQAGFAVLKAPDLPSVLVETAFLSNPHEEEMLRRPTHQRRIADALFEGTRLYFQQTQRA
ncbi:MAG: N-acetylmuramoyl-L-alanine amidase [Magnetococcales bacterium]|nr:N-acetylmuramoyl-L-alanine amidase [Magnetococcales bacterium]